MKHQTALQIAKNEAKIERAKEQKQELSKKYNVSTSVIVWKGNNKFIIVKEDEEITVEV